MKVLLPVAGVCWYCNKDAVHPYNEGSFQVYVCDEHKEGYKK